VPAADPWRPHSLYGQVVPVWTAGKSEAIGPITNPNPEG
jgi:hypothetical protein